MNFGIYILFYNRLDVLKTENNILNIIQSKAFKNGLVNLYLIDDCSDSISFIEKFKIIEKSFNSVNIKFVRNVHNLNIIKNPLNLFYTAPETYVSLLADDDFITDKHVDNYIDFILENKNANIFNFVNNYYEVENSYIIREGRLISYMNNNFFIRVLKYLFNQTDMYLYGFYKTETLKKYQFNNFYFFSQSPTSWAYTIPFFILTKGNIININSNITWNYNSKSTKHYIEYNENSKLIWYLKYIVREIELHFKYIFYLPINPLSIFIILILPIAFIHKNFTRIIKI